MSKNRWKAVRSALAFGPSDDASFDRDEWCFIDPMVTAFNEQMADVVNPGWLLCVDETMSAWRGKQGKRDSKKCPKLSWVPRKPEPLGTELKTAGCALSGMIITIEICKGKETHKDLEFFKEKSRFDGSEYGHTTATIRVSLPLCLSCPSGVSAQVAYHDRVGCVCSRVERLG